MSKASKTRERVTADPRASTKTAQVQEADKTAQVQEADKTVVAAASGEINPSAPADAPDAALATTPRKRRALEELVSVTVPRAFILTDDDGRQFQYGTGVQDIPRSHAQHWYARANGVEQNED